MMRLNRPIRPILLSVTMAVAGAGGAGAAGIEKTDVFVSGVSCF